MTNSETQPARPAEMAKAYDHQSVEQSLYTWLSLIHISEPTRPY